MASDQEVQATYITPEMSLLIQQTVSDFVNRSQGGGVDAPRTRRARNGRATLWRFTLNENMGATTTNEGEADILHMDGTDTGKDLNVIDRLAIFSSLTSGTAGLCLEQGGEFHIIQSGCP